MFPDYITEELPGGAQIHRCVDCKHVRTEGDWPSCPHEEANFGEEPLEPYFDEHISTEGAWITTRGQRRKLMEEGGLEYRKKRTDLLPSTRVYIDLGRKSR